MPQRSSRAVHAGHTLCHRCVKCACPAPEPPSSLPQLIPAPCPPRSCSRRDVNKPGCGSLPVSGTAQGPSAVPRSSWGRPVLPAPPAGSRTRLRKKQRARNLKASGRFGAGSAGAARCPPPRGVSVCVCGVCVPAAAAGAQPRSRHRQLEGPRRAWGRYRRPDHGKRDH